MKNASLALLDQQRIDSAANLAARIGGALVDYGQCIWWMQARFENKAAEEGVDRLRIDYTKQQARTVEVLQNKNISNQSSTAKAIALAFGWCSRHLIRSVFLTTAISDNF